MTERIKQEMHNHYGLSVTLCPLLTHQEQPVSCAILYLMLDVYVRDLKDIPHCLLLMSVS